MKLLQHKTKPKIKYFKTKVLLLFMVNIGCFLSIWQWMQQVTHKQKLIDANKESYDVIQE